MTFDLCMILNMTAANVLRISILMIQFWCYQRTSFALQDITTILVMKVSFLYHLSF